MRCVGAAKDLRSKVLRTELQITALLRSVLVAVALWTIASASLSPGALAQSKPRDPIVRVTIISEMSEAAPGETIWIAMHQNIYPGWHTYWLNAGDAGAPPTLDWHLPAGYSVGPLNFTPPERIPYMDLLNFGYSDEVTFPMQLRIPETARPGDVITLEADAHWLVCEEICIPEDGKVSLELVIGKTSRRDPGSASLIDDARASLPVPAPFETRFDLDESSIQLALRSPELALAFRSGNIQKAAWFPLNEGLIENVAEQNFLVTEEGLWLTLPRGYETRDFETVSGMLVFTQDLADGTVTNAFSFEASKGIPPGSSPAQTTGGLAAIFQAITFAFLGGLILNIMPCVFPVLFLKALTFMKHADSEGSKLRLEGLSYTAGVVISFAVLGGSLLALRAGGEVIGWGFQLQTPAIVGGLTFLLLAVGLSLSGVFSVGGSIAGVGSGLTQAKGQWGSFFTGVLATIVATPCTAPFMGAAMGFALTGSAVTGLVVFIFLGLGMATPFLLLAFFPVLASKLPRPGAWMERAKQALAFPMYGAAAWLAWVFALQTQPTALFALLLGMVLFSFALWLYEITRTAGGLWPHFGKAVVLLALVTTVVFLSQIKTSDTKVSLQPNRSENRSGNPGSLDYEVYSEARVEELTRSGKPVFVNFTAAWCISCLANEKIVFQSDDIQHIFKTRGITYLKADWTSRDPAITRALAKFGRAGVPLYLWYSGQPGSRPQILPQILTVGMMAETINK